MDRRWTPSVLHNLSDGELLHTRIQQQKEFCSNSIIIVSPREGGTHQKVEQDNYSSQSNYWLPRKGGTDSGDFAFPPCSSLILFHLNNSGARLQRWNGNRSFSSSPPSQHQPILQDNKGPAPGIIFQGSMAPRMLMGEC